MKPKQPTITIGIPTYEAGESLVATLTSIYGQSTTDSITRILLVVDGGILPTSIETAIRHPKLQIIRKEKREGQSARINQIFSLADSDLVVLTNDDVVWEHTALEALLSAHSKQDADLFCAAMIPLPDTSMMQYILEPGVRMTREIARRWNNGDNYLSCNGRLIALNKRIYKTIRLPAQLWNNDAYIYLRVKQLGHRCRFVEDAHCLYKVPQTLREHLRQTRKFRRSHIENQRYVTDNLTKRYQIPRSITIRALTETLFQSPLATIGYMILTAFITAFFFLIPPEDSRLPYWETDQSTKLLHGPHAV